MKYVEGFFRHFKDFPILTTRDAQMYLQHLGSTQEYAKLFIKNLLKKGKLNKLKRGFYTFGTDPTLASLAFTPSYHGLQEALSLHNLWEQETNTILVTPRKVRPGVRQMLGGTVIIHRIARKMFFGFETRNYYGQWINVSDVEKTLIDFVYFNQPLDSATLKEMKKRIDKKKLASYLEKCPDRIKRKIGKLFRQTYTPQGVRP